MYFLSKYEYFFANLLKVWQSLANLKPCFINLSTKIDVLSLKLTKFWQQRLYLTNWEIKTPYDWPVGILPVKFGKLTIGKPNLSRLSYNLYRIEFLLIFNDKSK